MQIALMVRLSNCIWGVQGVKPLFDHWVRKPSYVSPFLVLVLYYISPRFLYLLYREQITVSRLNCQELKASYFYCIECACSVLSFFLYSIPLRPSGAFLNAARRTIVLF